MATQFKVGTMVYVTSEEHGLENIPATVSITNLLGDKLGLAVVTNGGQHFAFFGEEITRCVFSRD